MAFTSALLLLLSLASQSLALPVAQGAGGLTTKTFDDGMWHPATAIAAASSPTSVQVPAISTTVATGTTPTSSTKTSSTKSSSTPTSGGGSPSTGPVTYRKFKGDGSVAQGWPAKSKWITFEDMWARQKPIMAKSCSSQNHADNSEAEMSQMKAAILAESASSGVDARFILATIMEESTGCVRVKSTFAPDGSVFNPGLMQDHNGEGTCFNTPAPCPESQIKQMIKDGTSGTASGDGLKQTLAKSGASDAQAVYIAARIYNSGSYDGGPLENTLSVQGCYSSDIANVLIGFAGAESPCRLGTAVDA
ncbi:hypothetical protein HYFRA_00000259 [Hymenoscyphus fraxineus]|uniref:Glycoside hydrolase n=1 Tax=Hymenoscyphus fraxineus TaxID=746836 RepID=A0A9N9L5I7_9HELO|nr:hypothetical protein HYFRA_00000259 [Hymenoscyphus fraxineus]